MNRNQHRVLNDIQVTDITVQVAYDLAKYKIEAAEILMDHYLRGDAEELFNVVSEWIEVAEDELKRQLNMDLIEDSFDDDNYTPSYDF
jgi:hypothetical protein